MYIRIPWSVDVLHPNGLKQMELSMWDIYIYIHEYTQLYIHIWAKRACDQGALVGRRTSSQQSETDRAL